MSVASGTSQLGSQFLLVATSVTAQRLTITIPSKPTGPLSLVGYFTVYLQDSTAPFQQVVIVRSRLWQPGISQSLPVGLAGGQQYTLVADWKVVGLGWSASMT